MHPTDKFMPNELIPCVVTVVTFSPTPILSHMKLSFLYKVIFQPRDTHYTFPPCNIAIFFLPLL